MSEKFLTSTDLVSHNPSVKIKKFGVFMVKSMTAYGRVVRSSALGRWMIEIHSVNRKALDFSIQLPKNFLQFEIDIRKWISQTIKRGQITVKVHFYPEEQGLEIANLSRLLACKEKLIETVRALGYTEKEVTFPFLLEQMQSRENEMNVFEDEEKLREELGQSIQETLIPFLKMREREGKALAVELEKHLAIVQNHLHTIENSSGGAEDKYRNKILSRLQEFKLESKETQDRILREVVLYAEKIDISEEIARLKSHIQQFASLLSSEEAGVGRPMDFLIQEMGREINTISAKSDDSNVSYAALKIKSELEKIREQVQNIE